MAVERNVISCDWCGQQLMVPVSKHASKQDTEALARAHASGWGWGHTERGDYCVAHEREALAPDPTTDGRGPVLRWLRGGRRGRAQGPSGVRIAPSLDTRNVQGA